MNKQKAIKRLVCIIVLVCGAFVMSSCIVPESMLICDFRTIIHVMNQTNVPVMVEVTLNMNDYDEDDNRTCMPYSYLTEKGVGRNTWHFDYLFEPNSDLQKMMNIRHDYYVEWCDLLKRYTCKDHNPRYDGFYFFDIRLFNLADTTASELVDKPTVSFFDYDTVYFDKSYKQQPGGMFIHNLYLMIDHSTLRSMKKDTTMLSRFPEYYGR